MLRYLWNDGWVGRSILGFVLIAMISVGIWAAIEEDRQWTDFRFAHNCRVVGRMSGNVATTVAPIVGGNGGVAIGVTFTPDKTGWLCDDGVTYWR